MWVRFGTELLSDYCELCPTVQHALRTFRDIWLRDGCDGRALVRAVPVGSRANAVCVCVNCMIYHCITVHRCTLIPVHTRARLGGALHGSADTRSNTHKGTLARAKRLICTDKPHAICGPRFPRYLCLSSGAELTPASVNPGMPNARTHVQHVWHVWHVARAGNRPLTRWQQPSVRRPTPPNSLNRNRMPSSQFSEAGRQPGSGATIPRATVPSAFTYCRIESLHVAHM